MVEIKNLTVKYGDEPIINDFSHNFKNGEITVILGKSGIGKTSLLNAVANLISYCGQIIGANSISYIFQEDRLIDCRSVNENVKIVSDRSAQEIEEILKSVELLDKQNSYPKTLSGGEKKRVNIARALSKKADVLLADEPFSALDISLKIKVANLIKDYSIKNGVPTIIVTHDLYEAFEIADEIILLDKNGFKKFELKTKGDGDLSKKVESDILSQITKLLTV